MFSLEFGELQKNTLIEELIDRVALLNIFIFRLFLKYLLKRTQLPKLIFALVLLTYCTKIRPYNFFYQAQLFLL